MSEQRGAPISQGFVLLVNFARLLAERYRTHAYLCGSALTKSNPRDWDVRLRLTHAEFKRRWGDPHKWILEGNSGEWTDIRWSWSNENAPLSANGSRCTGLNLDVQIYPAAYWKTFDGQPRLLLTPSFLKDAA